MGRGLVGRESAGSLGSSHSTSSNSSNKNTDKNSRNSSNSSKRNTKNTKNTISTTTKTKSKMWSLFARAASLPLRLPSAGPRWKAPKARHVYLTLVAWDETGRVLCSERDGGPVSVKLLRDWDPLVNYSASSFGGGYGSSSGLSSSGLHSTSMSTSTSMSLTWAEAAYPLRRKYAATRRAWLTPRFMWSA